jgi:hypothetical protein
VDACPVPCRLLKEASRGLCPSSSRATLASLLLDDIKFTLPAAEMPNLKPAAGVRFEVILKGVGFLFFFECEVGG